MRNILTLFFILTFCVQLSAQSLEIIIPGSVTNYESKAKIFGATLYLVQDGVTLSKTITTNTGEYNIVSKINKKIPFELIISKPNFITKKVYFDFKTITTKGQDPSVQAVSELVVELFAIKKGVSITVGPNDYAEKFTWDNDQKIAVPDEQYKKMSDDKIINFYKESENNAIVSILITKADASARAGNYQNALSYADSALTVKQNDSIILKKKVDYQKGWDALIADEKKAAEIVALLQQGEELIKVDKLPEATTKFNEVIKKDPANAEAKKQLDIIKGLTAAKTSQTKDAQELIKLRSNADKFIAKKQYSDAILELNKALNLSIPANDKTKVEADIADLKLKIKGLDIEKQLADELKMAKKSDDLKEYSKSKENYTKIAALLELLDPKIRETQKQLVNKQLDESLGKALKVSNELNSKSEYDKAIESYKLAEILINSMLDKDQMKSKLEEVKIHIAEVEQKRNDDAKKYSDAIAKVNAAIDNAPSTLNDATDLLSKDPLKNKSTTKEIIELKSRIDVLKKYYADKKIKIITVRSKDSLKANTAIIEIYTQAIAAKVSMNELATVKFSMDSLNKILNPNKKVIPQINKSGVSLAAPGIQIDTTNASASFQRLEFTRTSIEAGKQDYLTDLKNDIEIENYFRNTQQQVSRDEAATQVQNAVTEIQVLNQEKIKEGIEREVILKKIIQDNDYAIYQRELSALLLQEQKATYIQKEKNKLDEYLYQQQLKDDSIRIRETKNYLDIKNYIERQNTELAKLNELNAKNLQLIKNQVEIDNHRRDSISKAQQELAAKELVKQSNFVESPVRNPNYIRDEKGVCFAWNAVTERVYEIKNADGFVVSVIVRRVVVDQYGYGVVFEHTRNEKGISSFTLNGAIITEFIWFNESTGAGVLIPNLVVTTAC
jgi:hypothetical protein